MKIESVIKKIEKRLGVSVFNDASGHYTFTANGHVGRFNASCGGRAAGFHTRRFDDHSDSMTDYFAGSFYNNCAQMLNAIDPPPAKFLPGNLIRGKDNKRANRMGIAGRLGLVTKLLSYGSYQIMWCDTNETRSYSYERDLELIQ